MIRSRKSRKWGKRGVTVKVYKQQEPDVSKSLTIHGYSIEEIYTNIKHWFLARELAKKDSPINIIIEED